MKISCPREERLAIILSRSSEGTSEIVSFIEKISFVVEGSGGDNRGCGDMARETDMGFRLGPVFGGRDADESVIVVSAIS